MRKKMTKGLVIMLIMALMTGVLAGCGDNDSDTNTETGSTGDAKTLKFAYQYGLQYLPAKIVKDQALIEKYYNGDVTIEWQTLNSGAAVNESMIAGSIDGGMLGTSVAVTGINKEIPYKIFTGLSNIGNKLITNDDSINSLSDFKQGDQIALVNTGSIQHITLAMAAKEVLGDAHALDDNIVGMAHPDGMQALLAGSVKAQFTTIPYWNKELDEEGNHEITEAAENAAPGASIIVAVLSNKLYEEDPDLYQAVVKGFNEAFEYINNEENYEQIAAQIYQDEGITKEQAIEYLKSDDVVLDPAVTGLMELSSFMEEEGFLDVKAKTNESDYVFDGVEVKPIQ